MTECPLECGSNELRKLGEHWVLIDGGKKVCTHPWHNPSSFERRHAGGETPQEGNVKANLQWIQQEWCKWLATERGRQVVPSGEVKVGIEHLAKLFAAHCLDALRTETEAMDSLVGRGERPTGREDK